MAIYTFHTRVLLVILFLLGIISSTTQFLYAQSEHLDHIESIRQSYYKGKAENGWKGDSAFIEHVIQNVLEGPQDQMFITNRELLNPLCIAHCGRNEIIIHDTLEDNRMIDIELQLQPFDTASHQIIYMETDSLIELIDSLPAYGGVENIPTWEIDTLKVRIGGKELFIPKEAYANLYEPNLCANELFRKGVMAYPSKEENYFYVYIYGGAGADLYFAKLIFDEERYLKKIVTEYADLSEFDAFRWDFIGY